MNISHEIQQYAEMRGLDAESAREAGMKEMSEVFKATGAQVYVPVDVVTAAAAAEDA